MKRILAGAAAAFLAFGTAATAGPLSILGGSAGFIPGTAQDITPENDVLNALGLGPSLGGFFGATIDGGSSTSFLIEFIGSEAGNTNTFAFEGNDIFTGGGNGNGNFNAATDVGNPLASKTVSSVGGILDFVFKSLNPRTGATGVVANGANPDGNPLHNAPFPMNFFATFGDNVTRTGSVLWLFLDDIGQTSGDNHDDLVIRISIVPLPAGALLLLSGMGALALRRKMRA